MERRDDARDVEHFNRWADTYENSRAQRYLDRIHDAMLTMVASEAGLPETILDVGCGTGRFLRNVGQRWPTARLVGVDPRPICQNPFPDVRKAPCSSYAFVG
jgi:2-polyprenyl-3-methyl-5-hydroxy-6-metoxy-1,4-benzoquinol methylase